MPLLIRYALETAEAAKPAQDFELAKKILFDIVQQHAESGRDSALLDVLTHQDFEVALRKLVATHDAKRGALRARVIHWAQHWKAVERAGQERALTGEGKIRWMRPTLGKLIAADVKDKKAREKEVQPKKLEPNEGSAEPAADREGNDVGWGFEHHSSAAEWGAEYTDQDGCYGADPAIQWQHFPFCRHKPRCAPLPALPGPLCQHPDAHACPPPRLPMDAHHDLQIPFGPVAEPCRKPAQHPEETRTYERKRLTIARENGGWVPRRSRRGVLPRVLERRQVRLTTPWCDLLERCGYPVASANYPKVHSAAPGTFDPVTRENTEFRSMGWLAKHYTKASAAARAAWQRPAAYDGHEEFAPWNGLWQPARQFAGPPWAYLERKELARRQELDALFDNMPMEDPLTDDVVLKGQVVAAAD